MKDKKKVLIVDDDKDLREVIKGYLRLGLDQEIVEAGDGNEALRKAEVQKFDLVITDLKMPNLNGNSAIKHLRRLPKEKAPGHFLIITGFKEEVNDQNQDLTVIEKPFNKEELYKFITNVLGWKVRTSQRGPEKKNFGLLRDCLLEGALFYFDQKLQIPGKRGELKVLSGNEGPNHNVDLYGHISFFYPGGMGGLSLGMDKHIFSELCAALGGDSEEGISRENTQTVGEILESILLLGKELYQKKINTTQLKIIPSTPIILFARNLRENYKSKVPIMRVPIEFKKGSMSLDLLLGA